MSTTGPNHHVLAETQDRRETIRFKVTLVHGTFGRAARWTQPCSTFRLGIDKQDILFDVFDWSGGPWPLARKRAAQRLRQQLLQASKEPPFVPHFIIAHSHGGNIAFSALDDPAVAEYVRGVGCLATPFLRVRRRPHGDLLAAFAFFALLIGPTWLTLYLFSKGIDLSLPVHLAIVVLPLLLWLGIWKQSGHVLARFQSHMQVKAVARTGVLIVRAVGDEASALLAAIHFAGWFSTWLWQFVLTVPYIVLKTLSRLPRGFWVSLVVVYLVTGAVLSWLLDTATILSGKIPDHLMTPITVFMVVPAIALVAGLGILALGVPVLALTIVLAMLLLPISPVLAPFALFLDFSVESTPIGNWTLHLLRCEPKESGGLEGLRHSAIYDDPEVHELVRSWIDARLSKP